MLNPPPKLVQICDATLVDHRVADSARALTAIAVAIYISILDRKAKPTQI